MSQTDRSRIQNKGKVTLIGAGPGDPGLLTIRGRECLAQAGCIIYDRLAAPELLEYAPAECECIYVGKANHHHTMPQEAINALLVEKAAEHGSVVRLKGGDPYVFGRGGEEALYLLEHGVEVEVIPGVTSAVAVLAAAGIPITHRGLSKGFQVITAHSRKDQPADIDFSLLTDPSVTYVFLMGLAHVGQIAEGLMQVGRDPQTPAAVISNGTTAVQKRCIGRLSDIAERTAAAGLDSPAIIVVGEVVRLAESLDFFAQRPLFGKHYLVPYIEGMQGEKPELITRLRAQGSAVTAVRTGKIIGISLKEEDTAAVRNALSGEWILFTSRNGVHAFFRLLEELQLDARAIRGKIACVGKQTEAALGAYCLRADLVPEKQTGEALANTLAARLKETMCIGGADTGASENRAERKEKPPVKVTLFGAETGGEDIEKLLYKVCDFTKIAVYRNQKTEQVVVPMERFDGTFFSSGSNVRRLLEAADREQLGRIYSIGPGCSAALRGCGITDYLEAEEASYEGLLQAACRPVFVTDSAESCGER